jgi:hypothetical protein
MTTTKEVPPPGDGFIVKLHEHVGDNTNTGGIEILGLRSIMAVFRQEEQVPAL